MVTTQFFGAKLQRYMHDHGIGTDTLAAVAEKAFANGSLTPHAWRRTPLTREEILSSKLIAHPLTQYMLCSPAEGAAAVVLTSAERAADLVDRPVSLAAASMRTRPFGSFEVFASWLPPGADASPSVEAARTRREEGEEGTEAEEAPARRRRRKAG